jgi:hypothetical protein
MLDTLKYVNILEVSGFSREQAEAQVNLVREIMDQEFSTKKDLDKLEAKLASDINNCRNELSEKILGLSVEIHKLHNKTIYSIAGILGIFFAFAKFVNFQF